MSLLLVSLGTTPDQSTEDPQIARALKGAGIQGFQDAREFTWFGGRAWWFKMQVNSLGSGASIRIDDRFAAYVGSVHWQSLTGEALLARLLEDFDEPAKMPLHEFSGAFAMLFHSHGGIWLFNDAVGIQKIYETDDDRIISTSLFVCRATLKSPTVNRLRAQEYVLLGGNHGLQTAVSGVRIADPTMARELGSATTHILHFPAAWRIPCPFRKSREAVEALSSMLIADFESMADAFGSNIGMALSGGFDSRLLLAGLDRVGIQPRLYVYGAARDDDVSVATAVAARLGMSIETIDKSLVNAARPKLGRRTLSLNLAFFDGLPADGVFDRGADQLTRMQQVEGGRLNLNGGGGEIFRNFFYLRDRLFTAGDLVGAFYSNWLPGAIASFDERVNFLETIEDSVLECLGYTSGTAGERATKISRNEVELVYSLLRLRYWMGRNNTVAARYGAFITPLALPTIVALAASLPLAWKEFGALEASLIRAVSTRVAGGPSSYGFEFSAGPNIAHKLRVSTTLYRPLPIRRRSAQLRRILGKAPPVDLSDEWRDAAGFPAEVDWIDVRFLTEADQLNRLMSLKSFLSDDLCGLNQ